MTGRHARARRSPGRTGPVLVGIAGTLVAGAALVVLLTSGPEDGGPASAVPVVVATPAAAAVPDPLSLPFSWDGSAAVDPGWDTVPLEADGVFLGLSMPTAERPELAFVATDSAGAVLWEALRPPACSGVALSRTADGAVAVLTDVTVVDGAPRTTVSGYRLATGERVWGPVEAGGTLVGPGLVLADTTAALGASGPRVALDPATGHVILDEAAAPGTTILGEHDGQVLAVTDGALALLDATTGTALWNVAEGADWSSARPASATAPAGTALLDTADAAGVLVDLADGRVVATGVVEAETDPSTDVLVLLHDGALSGVRGDEVLWERAVRPGTRLAAAGGALVYSEADGAVQVHNVLTGAEAIGYAPESPSGFAVPLVVSSTGAAVVRSDSLLLLTVTLPPGF